MLRLLLNSFPIDLNDLDLPLQRLLHLIESMFVIIHSLRKFLEDVVEYLCLYRESARANPLGVFWLKLPVELRRLEG